MRAINPCLLVRTPCHHHTDITHQIGILTDSSPNLPFLNTLDDGHAEIKTHDLDLTLFAHILHCSYGARTGISMSGKNGVDFRMCLKHRCDGAFSSGDFSLIIARRYYFYLGSFQADQ